MLMRVRVTRFFVYIKFASVLDRRMSEAPVYWKPTSKIIYFSSFSKLF